MLAGGRWTRLASELDLLDRELATATAGFREAERAAVAAMAKRDELRGLLDAYKAKAARLGAAEDAALAERYDRAHDLLWTAPCDLAAAEAAVAGYQQAVLGVQPRRPGSSGSYRALARLTPDEDRRIELVDMANAIRPRTLT